VALNRIGVSTPVTVATTWLGPRMVPSVQTAVALPLESVTATRGSVAPFPCVTAKATDAPRTGRPAASTTFTTSPPGTAVPTAPDRDRSTPALRAAGGWLDGAVLSLPQAASAAAMASAGHRRKVRILIFTGKSRGVERPFPYPSKHVCSRTDGHLMHDHTTTTQRECSYRLAALAADATRAHSASTAAPTNTLSSAA
jgi:hypothetical protein